MLVSELKTEASAPRTALHKPSGTLSNGNGADTFSEKYPLKQTHMTAYDNKGRYLKRGYD